MAHTGFFVVIALAIFAGGMAWLISAYYDHMRKVREIDALKFLETNGYVVEEIRSKASPIRFQFRFEVDLREGKHLATRVLVHEQHLADKSASPYYWLEKQEIVPVAKEKKIQPQPDIEWLA